MSKIIMGEKLQLWLNGSCLAMANTLSVELSSDNVEVSCKDNGRWSNSRLGKISYTISSDCLFSTDDYSKLVDAMVKNTPLDIVFGTVSNFDNNTTAPDEDGFVVPKDGWKSANDLYSGKAVLTALSLSANSGEVSSYSITLNGVGALVKGGNSAAGKNT